MLCQLIPVGNYQLTWCNIPEQVTVYQSTLCNIPEDLNLCQ